MRIAHSNLGSTGHGAVCSPKTSSPSKGLSARFEHALDSIAGGFAKLRTKLGHPPRQQTIQIGYKPSLSNLNSPHGLDKPLPFLPLELSYPDSTRFSVISSVDTSRSSLDNPLFFTPDSLQSSTAQLVTPANVRQNVPPAFAPNVVMRSVQELPGFAEKATSFFSAMPTQAERDAAPSLLTSAVLANSKPIAPQARAEKQAPQLDAFFFEQDDSTLSFPEFEPRQ